MTMQGAPVTKQDSPAQSYRYVSVSSVRGVAILRGLPHHCEEDEDSGDDKNDVENLI